MPNTVTRTNTTNWFMLLATSTATDTTDIAPGIFVDTTTDLFQRTIPVRDSGWRGLEIMPFGSDGDTEVFTIKIQHMSYITDHSFRVGGANQWNFRHSFDAVGDPPSGTALTKQVIVRDYLTITCTLTVDTAPNVGVAGAYLLAADQLCDTVTIATTTFQTQLESAFGQSSVAYSPGSNVPGASLWIPDFGNPDFLRFDLTSTSTATMNCLLKLDI